METLLKFFGYRFSRDPGVLPLDKRIFKTFPWLHQAWKWYDKRDPLRALPMLLFTLWAAWDAYHFALIAQWREDQAETIWLGLTQPIWNMPVGHRSSTSMPMPNARVILSMILSRLPGLLAISFVLGFLQNLFLLRFVKSLAPNWRSTFFWAMIVITLPLLRATGVEFADPFEFVWWNALFFVSLLSYLSNPRITLFPIFLIFLILTPGLHLSGVVNACVYLILYCIAIAKKYPKTPTPKEIKRTLWQSFAVAAIITLLVWFPYFKAMDGEPFRPYQSNPWDQKIWAAYREIITFPLWIFEMWRPQMIFQEWQNVDAFLLAPAPKLREQIAWILNAQGLVFISALGFWVWKKFRFNAKSEIFRRKDREKNDPETPYFNFAKYAFLFIFLMHIASPLLGGVEWSKGEKPAQQEQFLPLLLLLLFTLPPRLFQNTIAKNTYRVVSLSLACCFIFLNVRAGNLIVKSHLENRGDLLTEADVPVSHKMAVVDFIAKDWKAHSKSNVVPVEYQIEGLWGFVTGMGGAMGKWYPYPFTLGRAYDYEFLIRHRLFNSQEGIQNRTKGLARYVISYPSDPPPQSYFAGENYKHYVFGRLRVTVFEDITTPITRSVAGKLLDR